MNADSIKYLPLKAFVEVFMTGNIHNIWSAHKNYDMYVAAVCYLKNHTSGKVWHG